MTTGNEQQTVAPYQLTERDREILEFERHWWKHADARETAIRENFDMSSTRYFQILNSLIDQPAALKADPMLVRRLQRVRGARRAQRAAVRASFDLLEG